MFGGPMQHRLKFFIRNGSGATAIEYALMALIVSIAIIASVLVLGGTVSESYNTTSDKVDNALN